MKFSLFYQLPCSDDQSDVTRYRETIDQVRLGDELGFHCAWLAELHFYRPFSIMPSPLIVATAIAQQTERIRLGIAVNLLPLWHPVRSAEDGATVDILSEGRLDFGVGRASIPLHFAGFNASREESRERFEESLEILKMAWTQQSFSHKGKFYEIPETSVVPKPLQKPHPPIRVAANSPETAVFAGREHYPVLVASVTNPLPRMAEQIGRYRDAWASTTPREPSEPAVSVMFFTHPGDSLGGVQQDIEASLQHYFGSIAGMRAAARTDGAPTSYRYMQEVEKGLQELSFDEITRSMAIFGRPEECVDRIRELQQRLQMQELICWFNPGGQVPHEKVRRAMERFAREVMPKIRDFSP